MPSTERNQKEQKSSRSHLHYQKNFTKTQLLNIITSNFYSILYYNADIWLLPTLSPTLKQKLLSASSSPLKLCTKEYNMMISFISLHSINNRAIICQISTNRHALCLHKLYNSETTSNDWLSIFFNQNFNARQNFCTIFKYIQI